MNSLTLFNPESLFRREETLVRGQSKDNDAFSRGLKTVSEGYDSEFASEQEYLIRNSQVASQEKFKVSSRQLVQQYNALQHANRNKRLRLLALKRNVQLFDRCERHQLTEQSRTFSNIFSLTSAFRST